MKKTFFTLLILASCTLYSMGEPENMKRDDAQTPLLPKRQEMQDLSEQKTHVSQQRSSINSENRTSISQENNRNINNNRSTNNNCDIAACCSGLGAACIALGLCIQYC